MTVTYTHELSRGSKLFGNFRRLLFRWKGSIYKLVLPDLCVYALLYYIINFLYRFWIVYKEDEGQTKMFFHLLVEYCSDVSSVIPLRFVLGFYVSQIVSRWWSQFMTTPWPDTLAIIVATSVRGHDDRGRMMRRTILRYVNVTMVMVFTMISPQARARFPTMDDLVESGFLVPHERIIIEHLNEKSDGPKYFVPIVWAGAVAAKARKEGRIRDDVALFCIIKELCKFRNLAGDLLSYDWVCVPITYTQVATLCTYVYFLACLFGKQLLQDDNKLDTYIPIFHFLEFFFLMGWLKVAETLINPFGEDDDDFEVNWLIDRNIKVSYMIVDEMNTEFPEMLKDAFWDGVIPDDIPYTAEAIKFKTEGMGQGSAALSDPLVVEDAKIKAAEDSIVGSMASMKKGFSLLPFHLHLGDAVHLGLGDRLLHHHELPHDHGHKHRHHEFKPSGTSMKSEDYGNLLDKTFVPRRSDSLEELQKKESDHEEKEEEEE